MSETQLRQEIYNFMENTLPDYEYERYVNYTEDEQRLPESYDTYMQHVRRVLNLYTGNNLAVLYNLKHWIETNNNGNFKMMDKENYIQFPVSGFTFNMEGNLVMFNER